MEDKYFNLFVENNAAMASLAMKMVRDFEKSFPKPTYAKELKVIDFSDDFKKEHGIRGDEKYSHLYIDGEKVSDTIYRYSGLSSIKELNRNAYVPMLKYVSTKYTAEEIKDLKKWDCKITPKHLKSSWVIIDTETGKEMIEFGEFDLPYIYGNIALCKNNYYHIPTGKVVLEKPYSNTIHTKTSIIAQESYNGRAAVINTETGEITYID